MSTYYLEGYAHDAYNGITGRGETTTISTYEGIGEFTAGEGDGGTFDAEGERGVAWSESSSVEVTFYHSDTTGLGSSSGPGYVGGGTSESSSDAYSKSHTESNAWSVYGPTGTAEGSHTESSSDTRESGSSSSHWWTIDAAGLHSTDSSGSWASSTHDSSETTSASSASGSMLSSTVVHQETSGDPPTFTVNSTTTSSSTTGTPPTAPEFLDEDDDEGDGDANEDWAGEGEWSAPEGDADGPYVWEPGTEGGYHWRGPGPRGDQPTEDFSPDPVLPDWQAVQDFLAPLAEQAYENPESLPQYTDAALAALGELEDPTNPTQPAVQAVAGDPAEQPSHVTIHPPIANVPPGARPPASVCFLYKARDTKRFGLSNVNHAALVTTIMENGKPVLKVLSFEGNGWNVYDYDSYMWENRDREITLVALPAKKGQRLYDYVIGDRNPGKYVVEGPNANNCATNSIKAMMHCMSGFGVLQQITKPTDLLKALMARNYRNRVVLPHDVK